MAPRRRAASAPRRRGHSSPAARGSPAADLARLAQDPATTTTHGRGLLELAADPATTTHGWGLLELHDRLPRAQPPTLAAAVECRTAGDTRCSLDPALLDDDGAFCFFIPSLRYFHHSHCWSSIRGADYKGSRRIRKHQAQICLDHPDARQHGVEQLPRRRICCFSWQGRWRRWLSPFISLPRFFSSILMY
ncbi:hypothetical protein EJB05_34071, partial [Eragrostis curvula]